jgi:N-acyl-D-aspartate/D-glutamate deacylase
MRLHDRVGAVFIATALAASFASARDSGAEPIDLLIRNGKIVDGTGNPWFFGDVAIHGDQIVSVGPPNANLAARRTIDATNMVVCPGFVDIHSHSDMTILEDGSAPSKIRQGVTTEVLGEDTSAGPAKGKRSPQSISVNGVNLSWTTLGGYFDVLERQGIAVNIASYAGLGTLLECAQGDSLVRPDARAIAEMKRLLEGAMDDGAVGLSSMLASARELAVTTEDLVELCQVVKRHGGLFSSHIRNEGSEVFEAVTEAIAVGRQARVPVDIIHLKIADRALTGRMNEIVRMIDQARRDGVNVQANVYPYTRGNNDLVSIIPPWAHEGGKNELIARLRNPSMRDRLKQDIRSGLPGWYNHYTAVGGDWSRMLVSGHLSAANQQFEGQTMDRIIAAKSGTALPTPDALDVLFDFLIQEDGAISTIYAHHSEEDMNFALVQPWCSVGSDGSAFAIDGPLRRGHPHPRNFGTFPRILGEYVRNRQLLRLEDAVRKMTSLNAAKIGLSDRGLLKPGQFADVVIFDPATVIDHSTYLEPFHYGTGISTVIVNGKTVLENGQPTSLRPGRALRHGRRPIAG